MTQAVNNIPSVGNPPVSGEDPSIFDFTDYRAFLRAFFERKKARHPAYSQSAFVKRAGMGANSRGYLKLVIEGKRSLTPHTIRGFSAALGLSANELLYFENLVFFNQAKLPKDKEYYFQRLVASTDGKDSNSIQDLSAHLNYYRHWYYPAIRELVALGDFREDLGWICIKLRGKVSRRDAAQALKDLERMGLLRRDGERRLEQATPLVKLEGGFFNFAVQNYHIEMMERAKESLQTDSYSERNASSVTLSCRRARLSKLVEEINGFRERLTEMFGTDQPDAPAPDCVVQINFQAFQLTPIGLAPTEASKENEDEEKS